MEEINILEMLIGSIIALCFKSNIARIIILSITDLIVLFNLIIYIIHWHKKGVI